MSFLSSLALIGFVICVLPLTYAFFKERKTRRELELKLKNLQLQTDEDMLGRGKFSELGVMSAGITHELSNPLSVILGRVTQLQRINLDSERKKDIPKGLEQIKVQTERMAAIIKSVREYIYRNDDLVEEFIPVKEIVDNVLVFCGQRLKNHGIELRLIGLDRAMVSGHRGQYEQAIMNLINNSFDAIDNLPEKWIEISAAQSEYNVELVFRDSGHGIPVEVRTRMLEPFYSTKKGKGTGLGLPLVKGIAQKNGGDLYYMDKDPHTCFMLELPRSTASRLHY